MKMQGEYIGATRSINGDLIVSFAIDEDSTTIAKMDEIRGSEIDIEVHKHSEKRSLQANAYFWQLCNKIAHVIGSDKDTVYLLQLSKYGVFADLEVIPEAVPILERQFKYIQEIDDGNGHTIIRAYFGSSTYNKEEMQRLIAGTTRDCADLGIETESTAETNRLIELWGYK